MPWRVAFALQADGWWLRKDNIWAKKNPMPESTRDRTTSAHEYLFHFAKNGAQPVYWTHRDGLGTRTQPQADYRWVRATGEEVAEEPDDWRTGIITCPACEGAGKVPVYAPEKGLFDGTVIGHDRCACAKRPKPQAADIDPEKTGHEDQRRPRRGQVWAWRRINLWRGRAYFYDADAVRQPDIGGDHPRHICPKPEPSGGVFPAHTKLRTRAGRQGAGANLRSVWTFPTQACSYAHYATFPDAIPERCILAGTSDRGACPDCGASWERVAERTFVPQDDISLERGIRGAAGQKPMDRSSDWDGFPRGSTKAETLGWRPTCECFTEYVEGPVTYSADPLAKLVPSVVLDPFAGTGTTCLAAKRLGRAFIGVELNPKDITYARRRLANQEAFLL